MLLKTLAIASILSIFLCFSGLSATPSLQEPLETLLPTTSKAIDDEIQTLEAQLEHYRSSAFKEEIQAQPYMFDSWHRFAEGIEQHENDEKHILIIKERLKKLYEHKAASQPAASPQPQ